MLLLYYGMDTKELREEWKKGDYIEYKPEHDYLLEALNEYQKEELEAASCLANYREKVSMDSINPSTLDPFMRAFLNIKAFLLINRGNNLSLFEPSHGLHPSLFPLIGDWLARTNPLDPFYKKHKVFTSNSDLLDHFTTPILNGYAQAYSSDTQKGIKPLDIEYLRHYYNNEGLELGYLYRNGYPGVYGWPF